MDIVLINPGSRTQTYQKLGGEIAAIEPPYWAAVIAAWLRGRGFAVAIIDANALDLTPEETAARAAALKPLAAAVMVYGSQPSASTQNMTCASATAAALRKTSGTFVLMGGLHPTALPERTLKESGAHSVLMGEGHRPLLALLEKLRAGLEPGEIPGLYTGGTPGPLPPSSRDLDEDLPLAAWDLLPMEKYRAHNWHCFDDINARSPYAALYTSLGCPYSCAFCCINALFGRPGIRYRSPGAVLAEIDELHNRYGVRNLKIIDELFIFDEKHYMPIVDGLRERNYGLNIWAYARVDTVRPERLPALKQAGINWLALGIESADPAVRDGAQKNMRERDIKSLVRAIQAAGIRVIGNYIFGLPDDTMESMRRTLDLAKDLNCEFANFYSAMAYPGSALYRQAAAEGWALPAEWSGFSQHSYDALPLPTRTLTAAQVLRFRDEAFTEYFTSPAYLGLLETRFGPGVRTHVEAVAAHRLKRRLLE